MVRPFSSRGLSRAAIHATLIFFSFLAVAPILVVASTALKTTAELSLSPLGLPSKWKFSNFVDAWNATHISQYMLNSVIVTAATLLVVIFSASLAGYALAVLRFRGEKVVLALFLLGLMVPPIGIVGAVYFTALDLGLVDTLQGLVLAEAAQALPLAVFIMRAGLKDVPRELREAAFVDGASELTTLVRVALPLAAPALAATAVLVFLMVWNDYLLPLVLINTDTLRTVPLGLSNLRGSLISNIVLIAAATLLSSLPSIAVYFVLQRQVIRGITQGAVK